MKKIKSCLLCGNSTFKFLFVSRDRMFNLPGEFQVKRCNSCFLVFLDPQLSDLELKQYYPSKKYYSYTKENIKGYIEILREYLIRHYYSPTFLSLLIATVIKNVPAMPSSQKKGKILDIGCGTGDTLLLLKELGWSTYGIDMDKNALEIGEKRGLPNLSLGTYRDLTSYPDNYFDAIRLYNVIEHLDDPAFCLKLIRKKLKKTGELIVGTPNIDSLVGRMFGRYWYNLDSPRHLFLFTPQTLSQLIRKEGFIVDKIEFCSAGGIAGSLQYYIGKIIGKEIDLIHKFSVVLLLYPLEWILDKFHLGDVFTIRVSIKE